MKCFGFNKKRVVFRVFKFLYLEIMLKNLELKSFWGVWLILMNKV